MGSAPRAIHRYLALLYAGLKGGKQVVTVEDADFSAPALRKELLSVPNFPFVTWTEMNKPPV